MGMLVLLFKSCLVMLFHMLVTGQWKPNILFVECFNGKRVNKNQGVENQREKLIIAQTRLVKTAIESHAQQTNEK